MTLRDYFACKTLAAILETALIATEENKINEEDVCLYCYHWADAMLKAREE